jgi:hypothetical protein
MSNSLREPIIKILKKERDKYSTALHYQTKLEAATPAEQIRVREEDPCLFENFDGLLEKAQKPVSETFKIIVQTLDEHLTAIPRMTEDQWKSFTLGL